MSSKYVNSDVIARLLKITPKEVGKLVSAGVIPRSGRDKYVLVAVVHAYIDYLRDGASGAALTQKDIASYLDISERRLRDLLSELHLDHRTDSVDDIRVAYIRKLRDEAAGRGDKGLAAIRERKERAQAMREEFELSKDYKLIVPTEFVGPDLISLIKEIQTQVMEAGNITLQSIESEHSVQINDDLVFEPLRTALGNIAGRASQLVASITGRPIASSAATDITDRAMDRGKHQSAIGE